MRCLRDYCVRSVSICDTFMAACTLPNEVVVVGGTAGTALVRLWDAASTIVADHAVIKLRHIVASDTPDTCIAASADGRLLVWQALNMVTPPRIIDVNQLLGNANCIAHRLNQIVRPLVSSCKTLALIVEDVIEEKTLGMKKAEKEMAAEEVHASNAKKADENSAVPDWLKEASG